MNIIKKTTFILLTFFLLGLTTACSKDNKTTDSQGKVIRLSDYKGKWIIINYWATWCKPCLKEMPALNNLYRKNRKKIVVLGVSYDQLSNEEIKNVSKKLSIEYPMMASFPIKKLGIQRLNVLPITFIINPEGKLTKKLEGPQTEAQFRNAIHIN